MVHCVDVAYYFRIYLNEMMIATAALFLQCLCVHGLCKWLAFIQRFDP